MTDSLLKLYNTLSRKVEDFTPLEEGKVGIYCCGPTVYDYQHIGNLKTYICEDVLVRTLRLLGFEVQHVMNITDVGHLTGDNDEGEDKMLLAAEREKKTSYEIAQYYTDVFFDDCDRLGIARPDVVCKATDHIQEMIDLIKRIEENGYTYQAGGNVYFDVSKFPRYGKLALLDLEKLKAGARIEVDTNKKSPFDFVLWFTDSKFKDQELQWDSPWGRGYPGWHIECSAMSIRYLGEEFDLHCGGIDHIPVHHTNEIAQSEAATKKPWVKTWFHSEFLLMDGEKMAKSKGGFVTLQSLIDQGYVPEVFRWLVLSANYRAQINFNASAMDTAKNNVDKLKRAVLELKESATPDEAAHTEYLAEFIDALKSDLNTPLALSVLWKVLGDNDLSAEVKLATIYKFDDVLGLNIAEWEAEVLEIPTEATELLEQRQAARAEKNWKLADQLRDQLLELGYVIEDSPSGAKLSRG